MEVKVLNEAGYEEALLGLSLSYNSEPSSRVADKLCFKQGGHNKFLESIQVWIDLTAPRYFHQQFDTYRVGTTKQSESTMHTLMRGQLNDTDFEGSDCDFGILSTLNAWILAGDFEKVKKHLPESFLQRRIVSTNYKVLQAIEYQRRTHKLPEWQEFLDKVLEGVENPQWILNE